MSIFDISFFREFQKAQTLPDSSLRRPESKKLFDSFLKTFVDLFFENISRVSTVSSNPMFSSMLMRVGEEIIVWYPSECATRDLLFFLFEKLTKQTSSSGNKRLGTVSAKQTSYFCSKCEMSNIDIYIVFKFLHGGRQCAPRLKNALLTHKLTHADFPFFGEGPPHFF